MASFIVGVMGKKRHGKDTFASRLVDAHGFTRIAFADPLKAAAYQLNPLTRIEPDETGPLVEAGFPSGAVRPAADGLPIRLAVLVTLVGWEAAKEVREVRRILQELGVSVRDNVHPEAWVRAAFRVADRVEGPVVITDVRFPNEVAAVRRARGLLCYVENPRVPDSGDTHPSETSTSRDDADRFVFNNGTVEQLFDRADLLAESIGNS